MRETNKLYVKSTKSTKSKLLDNKNNSKVNINSKNINLKKDEFNFKSNDSAVELCENYGDKQDIIKFLKIKSNSCDNILNKLEESKIQKHIINKITKYKKIPNNIIIYYRERSSYGLKYSGEELDKHITDTDIVNEIYNYLRIKYNKESIFNIDINFIINDIWTTLDEEGPRDHIFDALNKLAIKRINKNKYWFF